MKSCSDHRFDLDDLTPICVTRHDARCVSLHLGASFVDGHDGFAINLRPCALHIDALKEAVEHLEQLRNAQPVGERI